jgi:hypothetical protein
MAEPEETLTGLGTAVRTLLASQISAPQEIRLARGEFLERVAAREPMGTPARHPWRLWLLAGAIAAGVVALWTWTPSPLRFEIGTSRTTGVVGDRVRATSSLPESLRFSDGSSLVLHEDGRLRILATHPKGARVLVEDGTVDAFVVPAKVGKGQWSFEAGPFHLSVTGTKFTLTYQALDQAFGLVTQEGQVVVSGACTPSAITVRAGSRLDLACPAKLQPPPAPQTALPAAPRVTPGVATMASVPPRDETWRRLLAAGHLQEGLRAAKHAGFERVCQAATSKELLVLADAARLFEGSQRAALALHVLRQRFPASAESSTAAFTLGRIAFEQKHEFAEARDWFNIYLHEQPSGPLMGDAVGRLMESKLAAGDQAGARSDAERYLRRFPDGPYAAEARGILSRS